MRYLIALRNRLWDWWRPIWYTRIKKRPSVSLNIHNSALGHSVDLKEHNG